MDTEYMTIDNYVFMSLYPRQKKKKRKKFVNWSELIKFTWLCLRALLSTKQTWRKYFVYEGTKVRPSTTRHYIFF